MFRTSMFLASMLLLVTVQAAQADDAAPEPPPDDCQGTNVAVGDLNLNVLDRNPGVEPGGTVLLLHGFPDSACLWRYHIPALTDAGYRVIAPDLPGFGNSDKPEDVAAYAIPTLVGNLVGLLDALAVERVHVVGHDWGAAIAWAMAMFAPDRVASLVVLSVGHPGAFADPGNIEQQRRSFYTLYFQFEGVAEAMLPRDDWALWKSWFGPHPEQERWFRDLERPGALQAALAIYRANLRPQIAPEQPMVFPPVMVPTLGIWSTGDVALTEAQMTGSADFVSAPFFYKRIEGAGHWLPLDARNQVAELVLTFLETGAVPPDPPGEPDGGVVVPADAGPRPDAGPQPMPPPDCKDDGGCSAGQSPGTGMLWLLVLALVGLRRRSRVA